ncbi:hypothetical protein NE237_027916 [Protea cynaroides]|uniref:Uncharacterized protein n=1 Tax=Protea cynaroides TaxID=273540 RepID=A0A9Q0GST4_9MAGN|nr:hypothetical protein NE237_027916 [Protea cynaroides]
MASYNLNETRSSHMNGDIPRDPMDIPMAHEERAPEVHPEEGRGEPATQFAIKDPPPPPPELSNSSPPNVPIDSEEHQNFLKNRLKLTCVAVALTRASSMKPQDSTQLADGGSQASNTSQLSFQAPGKEYGRRTATVHCHVGELRKLDSGHHCHITR